MYKNLETSIFAEVLSKRDIAKKLGIGYNTLLGKLSGKQPMKLDEAFLIKQEYFPGKNIEWLFATDAA